MRHTYCQPCLPPALSAENRELTRNPMNCGFSAKRNSRDSLRRIILRHWTPISKAYDIRCCMKMSSEDERRHDHCKRVFTTKTIFAENNGIAADPAVIRLHVKNSEANSYTSCIKTVTDIQYMAEEDHRRPLWKQMRSRSRISLRPQIQKAGFLKRNRLKSRYGKACLKSGLPE